MSEKNHSYGILKRAYSRFRADIRKGKGAILGIALFYFLLIQFSYSTCPLLMITGIPCPCCGMTRAVFSLLKGNFILAAELNPMVFPGIVLAAAFVVLRYFTDRKSGCLRTMAVVFVVLLLTVYAYRMWKCFPDQWPMLYYEGNLMNRILRFKW